MFWAFIIGNVVYYAVGIILAFVFKDNRAFCKYICPVTIFLKPMSYFSLLRIKCDKNKCISCGVCKKVCPMEVDVTDNSRKRKNGTECILCFVCVKNCLKNALQLVMVTVTVIQYFLLFLYSCKVSHLCFPANSLYPDDPVFLTWLRCRMAVTFTRISQQKLHYCIVIRSDIPFPDSYKMYPLSAPSSWHLTFCSYFRKKYNNPY